MKELNLAPRSVQYQEVTLALQTLGFAESSITAVLDTLDVENEPIASVMKTAVKELGKQR
jgi:hypothetical protein